MDTKSKEWDSNKYYDNNNNYYFFISCWRAIKLETNLCQPFFMMPSYEQEIREYQRRESI